MGKETEAQKEVIRPKFPHYVARTWQNWDLDLSQGDLLSKATPPGLGYISLFVYSWVFNIIYPFNPIKIPSS